MLYGFEKAISLYRISNNNNNKNNNNNNNSNNLKVYFE